jgi:hypothetical protein
VDSERRRHAAFAFEFARIAKVDESHVVAAVLRDRLLDGQVFDLALRGVDHGAKAGGDLLRHEVFLSRREFEAISGVGERQSAAFTPRA